MSTRQKGSLKGKRPNVVLIITDDQGYGDLGCHGHPCIKTPHIDKFYDESTRFTRFQVSPICAPTRASLMTGLHEFRTGVSHVYKGRSLLREDNITIAEMLAEAGYKTGIFGKWHLGDNYPARPMDRGFQECLYFKGAAIGQSSDYWENTYFDPTFFHNGQPEKQKGFCTDIFFDHALRWIEENRSDPFFCYIPTNVPHSPFTAPEAYARPYLDEGLDNRHAHFNGMITNLNDNIARLTTRLKELGIEEHTLVIFMTDNGTVCPKVYNAGMRGYKTRTWEGGTRVPGFFRWPGTLKAGRDIDTIASCLDILPTLAELCGTSYNGDRELDGRSLLPLLEGHDKFWKDRYIISHLGCWPNGSKPENYKLLRTSVRSQRFRLVNEAEIDDVLNRTIVKDEKYLRPRNWKLHDMIEDPGEHVDAKEKYSEVYKKMRDYYDSWWDKIYPELDRYARIKLGSEKENPITLSCFDWFPSLDVPGEITSNLSQQYVPKIVAGFITNAKPNCIIHDDILTGSWKINIVRNGTYRIIARLLPAMAPEVVRLRSGVAYLHCGQVETKKPIVKGSSYVVFNLKLPKEKTKLECWFAGQIPENKPVSAFYVDIEYVG